MAKIFTVSLLALCALFLPTDGQQAEPSSASIKTGSGGSGSQNPVPQGLPGPGSAPRSRRRLPDEKQNTTKAAGNYETEGCIGSACLCCPRGKVYKECVSSTCGEYKCKHLYRFRERKCTADCRSGCFCAWPFFKNNDGRCVPFWQCYTYTFGRWLGRRPSVGMHQATAQPGSSGSASGPGTSGAVSGPQPGGSTGMVNQSPGGSDQLAGPLHGSSPTVPGWQPQGGWGSANGLENGGWDSGPNQYLSSVWGVPMSGYPDQWSFGNDNIGSGGISGNFVGGNGGAGIGHGNVGNGISHVGSENGGFGSVSTGLANGNHGLASGVGDIGNGIGGIGRGGFGRESMGLAGGNTGFGSGSASFIGSGLGSGPGGFTSSNGVFGTGNITPGAAKGLA